MLILISTTTPKQLWTKKKKNRQLLRAFLVSHNISDVTHDNLCLGVRFQPLHALQNRESCAALLCTHFHLWVKSVHFIYRSEVKVKLHAGDKPGAADGTSGGQTRNVLNFTFPSMSPRRVHKRPDRPVLSFLLACLGRGVRSSRWLPAGSPIQSLERTLIRYSRIKLAAKQTSHEWRN